MSPVIEYCGARTKLFFPVSGSTQYILSGITTVQVIGAFLRPNGILLHQNLSPNEFLDYQPYQVFLKF